MEAILKYQEIDGQLKLIENEIVATDEYKKYRSAKAFLSNVEEALKKMDQRAGEINFLIANAKKTSKEFEDTLEEYLQSVAKSQNDEELNYLSRKVNQLAKGIDNLEIQIINLQNEMKEIAGVFDEYSKKVPVAKKQFTANRELVDQMKKQKESEVTQLKRQLVELEKIADEKILNYYKKLKQENVKNIIVPLLDGSRCGGCNMDIPLGATMNLDSKKFIICDNCRRVIYKK